MAAITATTIKKGQCIKASGDMGIVLDLDHRTPGKGNAIILATIRSLQSGKTKTIRFASSDKVEVVPTERQKLEYSYADGDTFSFMDPQTYESFEFSKDLVGEGIHYLVENLEVEVLSVDGNPVSIELPPSVEMEVTVSSEGIKGDTANNPQKPATVETGLEIQVPLFIKPGDRVKIDSRTGKYVGRV